MKNHINFLISAVISAALIACGGSKTEENKKDNKDSVKTVSENDKKENSSSDSKSTAGSYEEKMKQRRAKGDTLAMPYAELQKYLPSSIDGYKAGKPSGASINMMQMSYSTADIRFKKDNGDWVKVTIIDYNQAYGLYSSATAMWAMGMSMDTPEETASGVKLDNTVGGWQLYKKKSKNATLTVGVGNRFWLNVEANNQADAEFVKAIASKMDLSTLAAL